MQLIYKRIGETPLEAIERFRALQMNEAEQSKNDSELRFWRETPMTYAGRLDPLAEGALLVLWGEECKEKEKYLGLDKEYEVDILFGIETDSHDALGIASLVGDHGPLSTNFELTSFNVNKYIGKFEQEYPPYSSKTVNGKQLHELARTNNLPDKMPSKIVEVYEMEQIGEVEEITPDELLKRVINNINLVKGNFRQDNIKKSWEHILHYVQQNVIANTPHPVFPIIKLRVRCSSGSYMRSLAHRIGKDLGTGAIALSIKRTRIYLQK